MSDEMRDLITTIHAANQELSILLRDRDCHQVLGPPLEQGSLLAVQQRFGRLGMAVPPSYLEFLRACDGWKEFFAELDLLSGHDQSSAWVAEVARVSHDCFGPDDPFVSMVPVGLIPETIVRMVFLDPAAVDEAGEANVVVYEDFEEAERHPSFRAYLEWYSASLAEAVDHQKNGDP